MNNRSNRTLMAMFQNSVETYANRPALGMIDGQILSYAEFGKQVEDMSEFLRKEGIDNGDRVAILSENCVNWVIAFFAVTTMGAVAVPILPEFHANEVQHILRHSQSKAIFISEKLYNKLEEMDLVDLKLIILIDNFSIVPKRTSEARLTEMMREGSKELAKLRVAAKRLTGLHSASIDENDLVSIIYTSGTTGHSKGVMLTHKNIISDAEMTLQIVPVNHEDRLLSILPLSHTYENTLGLIIPVRQGASIYYLDKPPTARVLLPAMQKIKPTMMLTVPLVIEKIYKMRILPQFTSKALMRKLYKNSLIRKQLHRIAGKKLIHSFGGEIRFFGVGGAALSPEVEMFLREANFPYAIGYGLTETSPLIAGTGPALTRFRSTGPAIPGVQLQIRDQHPITGEGEIVVKGDNVMQGYFNDPERTREILSEDGWLRTGDLGRLDKDNYLYIKGRLKNMILGPSGENIYPEGIESIINESDWVLESLVYEQHGQLIARVHLNYEKIDEEFRKRNTSNTQIAKEIETILANLRNEVNSRVSSFSRLQRIIEQPEPFEKTPTQKIKRYLYTQ